MAKCPRNQISYISTMEIRTSTTADTLRLGDIDGTIESSRYLYVKRQGTGFSSAWQLEERPLREKLITSNPLDDETQFAHRQIVSGADEGLTLVAEHDHQLIGSLIAQSHLPTKTLRIIDLRVDYDCRRQGIGLAMLYRSIQEAAQLQLRAVRVKTLTNNAPAAQFLARGGFELAGLDAQYHSNHDLVKEAVSLFWYAALD
jgi:ribosomal protein S18 acetylase RimI-like enzyme